MTSDIKIGVEFKKLIPLWKEAFGDGDEFLSIFKKEAYSPKRCACILKDGEPVSALYWLDCEYEGERVAYLYAIATKKSERGKGLCKRLMRAVHSHLFRLGYGACLLVPSSEELFSFYSSLGYESLPLIDEFESASNGVPTEMREISADEFIKLRRSFLPRRAVLQEGACINFLKNLAKFYTGPSFLLTARREGDILLGLELLGDKSCASGILAALGFNSGVFRAPGHSRKFAMLLRSEKFTGLPAPEYFAFAFD